MEAVGNNMTTNLEFSQLKGFINYMTSDNGMNIESVKLKGSDSYINGAYYYQLDPTSVENVKYILQSHLNLAPTTNTNQTEAAQSTTQQ